MSVEIVPWSSGTDEQIAAMLDAAASGEINLQQDAGWAVGDARTIHINAFTGGESIVHAAEDISVAISSFEEYMGCGNLLQFDFVDCLSEWQRMNSTDTTVGGYGATEMYTVTLPALCDALPDWLKSRLKTFSVRSSVGGDTDTIAIIETVTGNKLALRSEIEIFGKIKGSSQGEGSQIELYRDDSTRIKKQGHSGTATIWWERSADTSMLFCSVTAGGKAEFDGASYHRGVAPFGCLGGIVKDPDPDPDPSPSTGIEINATNFPDAGFRSYISENFDTDSDGWLSDAEINNVTSVEINNTSCTSLAGIEFFTELISLSIPASGINSLELHNSKLVRIDIGNTTLKQIVPIASLSLVNIPSLAHVSVYYSELSQFAVTNCPNLITITINYSLLTNFSIPNSDVLSGLSLAHNHLTSLDVSGFSKLTEINCKDNSLTTLDLQENACITQIDVSENRLQTLLLPLSPAVNGLNRLYCEVNQLTYIDLTKHINISRFSCYGNQLSELNIGANIYLRQAYSLGEQQTSQVYIKDDKIVYSSESYDHALNVIRYDYADSNYVFLVNNDTEIIVPSLRILAQPQNFSGKNGERAYFAVSASGYNLYCQWQVSVDGNQWDAIPRAAVPGYSSEITYASNGHQFRCVLSDPNGNTVISNAVLLTVISDNDPPNPLAILTQPVSIEASIGSTAVFSVVAQGTEISYQWQVSHDSSNWSNLAGATLCTCSRTASEATNGDQYRCVIVDGSGNSLTSNAATLSVVLGNPGSGTDPNPNPGEDDVAFEIIRQPKNTTAISGAEATFSVVAQGIDLSYQWQFSSDSGSSWLDVQSDGRSNAYTFTVGDAQNGYLFRCIIAQGTETLTTDSVRLTVRELPSSPERRTYLPSEMADAIRQLGLAGIDLDDIPFGNMPDGLAIATLGSRGATSPEWYEEIAEAINVLKTGIDIEDYQIFKVKTITENGEYAAVEDDCYGFSLVDVDVFGGDSIVDRTVSEPYSNDKITKVGAYAFCSCNSLPAVDVPNCTTIDVGAFMNCTSLSSINAPNCSFVGTSAFQNCRELQSISLPSCISVGDYAFDNCYVLSSIDLPVCKKIGSGAFRNCSSLVSVDFPLCEMIGDGAFQVCRSLASVSLPVCSIIGNDAFNGCSGLLSIELPLCKNIGTSAFRQCNNLAEVSFPECTTVNAAAFYKCSSLASIALPNCSYIGQSAFASCISLSYVSIPACSHVSSYAFSECSNLAAISLPNCSVICRYAFYSCQKLLSLYLYGSSVCRLTGSDALSRTAIASGNGWIYVPPSLYSAYISASYWSYYSSRFYYEINVTASMNGMILELSGAGATLSSNSLLLSDITVSMSSNQLVFP